MSGADLNDLKIPPNSMQAEQAVIGALLLDNQAWVKVQGVLRHTDFYQKRHQILFWAIGRLLKQGDAADVITVADYLDSKDQTEAVGGLPYIGMLAKDTPSAANIAQYAKIVRDKSILRQIIMLSSETMDRAFEPGADAKEELSRAEAALFQLAQANARGQRGFSVIRDVLRDVCDEIERSYDRPKSGVLGVPFGFRALDELTLGACEADLIIIAGRPSMGKTALALNVATNAARAGFPVAFFSLEQPLLQIGQRVMSSRSKVPLQKIRAGWRMEESDFKLMMSGVAQLSDVPLYVDDMQALTVSDMRSLLMRLNGEIRAEHPGGIRMVVIDYLQMMGTEDQHRSGGNRNNDIEAITRALKAMAKEFGIPIILLSQLNRNVENRPNKRPYMSDLRDSGAVEQDADLILFPYRDEVYNKETADVGKAEIIIAKQRNGPLGTVMLGFEPDIVLFRDLYDPHEGYGY